MDIINDKKSFGNEKGEPCVGAGSLHVIAGLVLHGRLEHPIIGSPSSGVPATCPYRHHYLAVLGGGTMSIIANNTCRANG